MDKLALKNFVVLILDDESGITMDAFGVLLEILEQNDMNGEQLKRLVETSEGRVFLDEGFDPLEWEVN